MTTYLGLNQLSATSPDYQNGTSTAALLSANMAVIDTKYSLENDAANGTIQIKEGKVFITKGSAIALTLNPPAAGSPATGGDDGKTLEIMATTAFAHVVTAAAANQVNGSKQTMTWAAAIGNNITLKAFNGIWYTSANTNVTLS